MDKQYNVVTYNIVIELDKHQLNDLLYGELDIDQEFL